MDYTGLIQKYPLNRPLTDVEMSRQMHQGIPSGDQPWAMCSTIKMNSTYLECVDKFFKEKGGNAAEGLTFSGMFVIATLCMAVLTIIEWQTYAPDRQSAAIDILLIFCGASAFMVFICWSRLRSELFTLTHFPMRFNRKNRMVYVTRLDGTVMTESWDKLFFAEGQCRNDLFGNIRDVRGHRLAEDGKTVLDTFALPFYSDVKFPRRFCVWEFVRRYMEEGPEKLMRRVEMVNDVSDRRETFLRGLWHQSRSMFSSGVFLGIILFPGALWYATARWIAVRTCKIPRWPDEVEAQCQIDPDDPYVIDRDHPPVFMGDTYDSVERDAMNSENDPGREMENEAESLGEQEDKDMETTINETFDVEEAVKRIQERVRRTGYYKRGKQTKRKK